MKNKKIVLTIYDCKVINDRMIFTGRRGEDPKWNQEKYDVHIILKGDWWFQLIAKRLKLNLISKIDSIQNLVNEI